MAVRRSWLLTAGLVGIFLAGAVTGVLAAAGYVHHHLRELHSGGPRAIHALGLKWLDRELDLSPSQERAIDAILLDAHHELFRFKSRHDDEIRAIVVPALERFEAELTPEQAERWAATRARILEHVEATVEDPHGR
jgi:hypothetical protein